MEITIKIDKRSKQAKAFFEYIKTLPFIEVETEKPRYNAETEKAIKDVREGRVLKAKNSKDLFRQLGI